MQKVGQDVYAVCRGITRSWTATIPSFVPEHQTPADVPSPSSSQPEIWTRMTRVRTQLHRREDPDGQAGPGDAWGEAIQGPLEGICCIQGFVGASEQFVPRYTTVWMDDLRRKNISLDVKDVLVHLVAAVAP